MQEIVVQSTKYPEIVVQGSRYDYTSDIVLVVVGVLAAAAILGAHGSTGGCAMRDCAVQAMTFDEVVLGRRSIRGFKRQPVPKALIREVIAMAMRAADVKSGSRFAGGLGIRRRCAAELLPLALASAWLPVPWRRAGCVRGCDRIRVFHPGHSPTEPQSHGSRCSGRR